MPPVLSVVVPIYNVEDYLAACLDSLAQQTQQGLEVLLIDDGSTDRSGTIADDYAQRHGWLIRHVENGGLGRARNIGAADAQGEYLCFLDSDDVVPPDGYELLVSALEQTGSDFAVGQVLRYDGLATSPSPLHRRAITRTRLATSISQYKSLMYDTTAWNKVYRRSFWLKHGLEFPEGVYYEDIPVTLPAHFLANAVDVIDEPVYWWRQRQTAELSITQRRNEIKNLRDRLSAVESVNRFLMARGDSASKEAHDRKVLTLDIPLFMNVLHEADADFNATFMQLAKEYVDTVHPATLATLNPWARLKYALVTAGRAEELHQVLEVQRDPKRPATRFSRHGIHLYAELPFFDDPSVGLNRELFRVSRTQPVNRRVDDLWWEGDTLWLRGFAHIDRVPNRNRWYTLRRFSVRRTPDRMDVSLRARAEARPDVDAGTSGAPVSHLWSGFRASLDVRRLPADDGESEWRFVVQLVSPSARRGVDLKPLAPGTAKHPPNRLLSNGLLAVPTVSTSGALRLLLRRPRQLVTAAEIDGGEIRLTIHGESPAGGFELGRAGRGHDISLAHSVPAAGEVHVQVPLALIQVDARDAADYTWQVWPVDEAASEPIDCLTGVGAAPFEHAGRLLGLGVDDRGRMLITSSPARPWVESSNWRPGVTPTLEVAAVVPSSIQLQRIVLQHSSGEEREPTWTRAGDRLTIEVPWQGPPGTAAVTRLGPFRWSLMAEFANWQGAVTLQPLVLTDAAIRGLGEQQYLDGFEARLEAGDQDGLVLLADGRGPYSERGAANRHRQLNVDYPAARRQPIEETVLFEAWKGRQCSDSPRAIYEELRRRDTGLRLVWAVQDLSVEAPEGAERVVRFGADYVRHLGRSRFVVSNDSLDPRYVKRQDSRYLQTWHGTPLKRIGFDIEQIRFANRSYLDQFAEEVTKWDWLVSPNAFSSEILARAFRFDGPMLETGYPRNDVFYRPQEAAARRTEVKRRLGLDDDRSVLLYAPTWRDHQFDSSGNYQFAMRLDLERMRAELGDRYVLLVRGHQLVADRVGASAFSDFVVNVSRYPDIADLYLAADALITDYSSVMFDFANTGRPMFFFTWDLAEYRDELRGFYFDFEAEAPGPIVEDTKDLIAALHDLPASAQAHADRYEAFRTKFCSWEDGGASLRVVDRMLAE